MRTSHRNLLVTCLATLCLSAVAAGICPKAEQIAAKQASGEKTKAFDVTQIAAKKQCDGAKAKQVKKIRQCGGAAKARLASSGAKTCGAARKVADANKCQITRTAQAYFAAVQRYGEKNAGDDFCAGGAAIKGLLKAMSQDENYRPIAAQIATTLRNNMDAIRAAATEKTSDGEKDAKLASNTTKQCDSAKRARLADARTGDGDANARQVAQNISQCCKQKRGDDARAVRVAQGQGADAAQAKFVAFDCAKTDGVARAAAKAYVNILVELKKATGAEGCPMNAARQTLAAVMNDIQNGNAETAEATAVSLGARLDKATRSSAKAASETTKATCGADKQVEVSETRVVQASDVVDNKAKQCGEDCSKSCCRSEE